MDYPLLLQQYKLKVTPQRLEILNIIDTKGHINIDDLYKMLRDKFPTLSLATIYKNINKMCDNKFLSEVKVPNQKSVYELRKKEHHHIVCTKCNEILDMELNINDLKDNVENLSKYHIQNSSIVFNGVCSKCSEYSKLG